MSNYRRAYVPGGTYFLTIVTFQRRLTFTAPQQVEQLRCALKQVMREAPFQMPAAVVLPDHLHFLWSLPRGDSDYPRRVGRMKVLFTRSLDRHVEAYSDASVSRLKHREADVWQRRFWEHTIVDEEDFERHLDYVHDNPVKHGLVACAHLWPYSSFSRWVEAGHYHPEWGSNCDGRRSKPPADLEHEAGE